MPQQSSPPAAKRMAVHMHKAGQDVVPAATFADGPGGSVGTETMSTLMIINQLVSQPGLHAQPVLLAGGTDFSMIGNAAQDGGRLT